MLENIKEYADESAEFMEYLTEALKEALDNESFADFYQLETKELECRPRSGFIPHSHNKGGVKVYAFTDLEAIRGSGYYPRSQKTLLEVEQRLKQAEQFLFDDFLNKYSGELAALDKNSLDLDDLPDYLRQEFYEYEDSHLSDDYSHIMLYIQAKYEGRVNGLHVLYLTAAVNFDAPYFRVKGHEVADSSELKFKTTLELKEKLPKILSKLATQVF